MMLASKHDFYDTKRLQKRGKNNYSKVYTRRTKLRTTAAIALTKIKQKTTATPQNNV